MGCSRCHVALSTFVALAFVPAIVSATTIYSPDPHSCEIIGDPELYGIGIRIGSYLQWAAIFLAILLVPENAIGAFLAANVLTLAIFISFFDGAMKNDASRTFLLKEWSIVLFENWVLYLGFIPAIFWIHSHMERSRLILSLQIILYGIVFFEWAYIFAIQEPPERREGCKNILKHYSRGKRIFGTISIASGGALSLVTSLLSLWQQFRRSRQSSSRVAKHDELQSDARYLREWNSQLNRVKFSVVMFPVAIAISVISYTEAGLKHDQINTSTAPFNSTSQLIAFLVGLFNLLYICWHSLQKGWENWPLTSWYRELRTALDYLLHRNKLSSEAICIRLSELRSRENRNLSRDSSLPEITVEEC